MAVSEGQSIESKAQNFLSKKLSRREGIRVLAGAAISLETFLAACSKKTVVPFCEGAAVNPIGPLGVDCTRFPAIEVGKPIEESLNQTIQPITQLLPESSQNQGIYFHTVEEFYASFTALPQVRQGKYSVQFFFKEGEPLPPLELLRITGYHEMIHIFDKLAKSTNYHDNPTHTRYIFGQNRLFSIVKEGTYLEEKYSQVGHPQDDFLELYASTLTVMRFFPGQFIQKIQAIGDSKVQKVVATWCLDAYGSLKSRAHKDVEDKDLPYDQEMISTLKTLTGK